jgi:hypothetical protein
MVEVAAARPSIVAPFVMPDLPPYESPITGEVIDGRRQRREDLKRHGARPWEGLEAEKREAARIRAENERRTDQLAEKMAHIAWAHAPERIRRLFRSR